MEVARIVVFLASVQADYTAGQSINIAGGLRMRESLLARVENRQDNCDVMICGFHRPARLFERRTAHGMSKKFVMEEQSCLAGYRAKSA
jgi:nitrate/nitrite-specific signal transduction histidine kinase